MAISYASSGPCELQPYEWFLVIQADIAQEQHLHIWAITGALRMLFGVHIIRVAFLLPASLAPWVLYGINTTEGEFSQKMSEFSQKISRVIFTENSCTNEDFPENVDA